jgi:hypothetical protein
LDNNFNDLEKLRRESNRFPLFSLGTIEALISLREDRGGL